MIEQSTHDITCPVCGSDLLAEVDRYEDAKMLECEHCSLIFVYPRPDAKTVHGWYAIETYQPFTSAEDLKRWREVKRKDYEHFHALLGLDVLDRSAAILDVGCSTGALMKVLLDRGFENITGLEIDPSTVQFDREELGLNVLLGELVEVDLDREFDLVIFGDSLEHMRDPARVISKTYQILRNGGRIAIRCPNSEGAVMQASYMFKRLRLSKHWLTLEYPLHLYHFNSHNLSYLLRAEGFKDVKTRLTHMRFWYFSRLRVSDLKVVMRAKLWYRFRRLIHCALWLPVYLGSYSYAVIANRGDAMFVTATKC